MIMKISLLTFSLIIILIFVPQFQDCSVRVKRVIGGKPDNSPDHGFLAALIGKKGYRWDILKVWGEYRKIYCSGALISDQWIVTAAHCFSILKEVEEENNYQNDKNDNSEKEVDEDDEEDYEKVKEIKNIKIQSRKPIKSSSIREIIDLNVPSYWKIRLGVKNLKPTFKEIFFNFFNKFMNKSTPNVYYEISKIIRHPLYTPWCLENDLALVKLTHKFNIKNVKNTFIPMTNYNESSQLWPIPGQLCKVIGWGCNEFEGPIMEQPHYVNLPVLNPDYCRKIYRADINLTDSQEFCAGYYDKNKGICAGDSGGPLLCSENGIPVLSGVVSATHIDNPNNYPGIFSRISYFKSWINDVIANN